MTGGLERFLFTFTKIESSLIAHAHGDMDLPGVVEASTELLETAAARPALDLVVLDLTDVTHLSAAAVHAVRRITTVCAARGITTGLVVEPDSITAQVVAIGRLGEDLPSRQTCAAAAGQAK